MQTFRNGFDRVRDFLHHHPYWALFVVYLLILSWLSGVIVDFLWPLGWWVMVLILGIVPVLLIIFAMRKRYLVKKNSNVIKLKRPRKH